MPPELRKRKAPAPPPGPPAKKQSKVAKVAAKVKEAVKGKPTKSADTNGSSKPIKAALGDVISLDGFGGEIETSDGSKTTLKALVDESKSGIVLFTYPKASTPGCTNQACLFRDSYESLTKDGIAIYGLSTDSPKANTTFKTKQNLPYTLLCDPGATLINAIGFKKAPKGTTRGVFAIDKSGKVLLAEPGSPAGTVDAVKKLLAADAGPETKDELVADQAAGEDQPANGEVSDEKKVDEETEKVEKPAE